MLELITMHPIWIAWIDGILLSAGILALWILTSPGRLDP